MGVADRRDRDAAGEVEDPASVIRDEPAALPSRERQPCVVAEHRGQDALRARFEVGVIDSGQFSSLHPGYYVVFTGVYSSADEAEAALRTVRASGFSSAYTRQISR